MIVFVYTIGYDIQYNITNFRGEKMKVEIGKFNNMKVAQLTKGGALLVSGPKDSQGITLPNKQLPSGLKIGDNIKVFVYRDSEDKLTATTKSPIAQVGDLALLKAVSVTKIGAFFDWGLEKDVFMPFKEITYKIIPGQRYLVALYIDKSDRVCATSKIYSYLNSNSPYKVDDEVEGVVYNVVDEVGAFVAVNNRYYGLIPKTEVYQAVTPGDTINVRVIRVREDGKLDLSLRKKAYKQMSTDAQKILKVLEHQKGFLPLNDESSPEAIKLRLGMSKSSFKRALGNLLRANKVVQVKEGIKIKPENGEDRAISPRKSQDKDIRRSGASQSTSNRYADKSESGRTNKMTDRRVNKPANKSANNSREYSRKTPR